MLAHLPLLQRRKKRSLGPRLILGELMLNFGLWIELDDRQGSGLKFHFLLKLARDILFIRRVGLPLRLVLART